MSETITLEQTVGTTVARHPQTRRVFEQFGIDYCCGGAQPLGRAAVGLDRDALLQALEEAAAAPPDQEGEDRDWSRASLTELADHIEQRHHTFMRENLPRLGELLARVLGAHSERHGRMLRRLRGVYTELRNEIEMHLAKEEQILFPYIRSIEAHAAGRGPRPQIHCITVQNPVNQMMREHENAGAALETMRELTDGYTAPRDACESFRALYEGLQALERDLHQHIHLENNILFPRAVELESTVLAA